MSSGLKKCLFAVLWRRRHKQAREGHYLESAPECMNVDERGHKADGGDEFPFHGTITGIGA